MKDIMQEYRDKLRTPEEVVRILKTGNNVIFGTGATAPVTILNKMHLAAEQADDLNMLFMAGDKNFPFLTDPKYAGVFHNNSVFSGRGDRVGYARNTVSYVPAHLGDGAPYWLNERDLDVFYGVATPMDENGNFRLAPCLTTERHGVDSAKTVVLEVSPNFPVVYGDTLVNIKDVDYIVETDLKMDTIPNIPPDEQSKIIGGYIAEMVHDGDCIQLGIGAIPNAVALELKSKKDLGIHTEMMVTSMLDLIKCGAVNNSRKTLHPGKSIACFVVGTQELYDYIDHNPDVEFYKGSYVIDPRVIMQNDNMVSINTGFSCDLTGQVSSEAIGTRMYSGTGGQAATAKGAVWAKNGRSFIALRSTVQLKDGSVVSNIKAVHDAGTVISLSRNDVDYIVTEYGIAHLRGHSISERIKMLINIAHPDFRDQLKKDAEKYYY